MNEDVNPEAYAPDFAPYAWTPEDRKLLEPFVTNLDGLVAVLRNLPPEIAGALCSRASRATGSLTEVLLKEYLHPKSQSPHHGGGFVVCEARV